MKRKFPFYSQLDSADCGPSCLRMIAEYYGKSYSLQEMRDLCHSGRAGVSMAVMADAANSIGLKTRGVQIEWNKLKEDTPLPCIVHWQGNHFVVVYDVAKRKKGYVVTVADPCSGFLKYSSNDFIQSWCGSKSVEGYALLIEPDNSFFENGPNHLGKEKHLSIWTLIKPYKWSVLKILSVMMLCAALSMVVPYTTQMIVDRGINAGDMSIVTLMLIAQFLLALGILASNLSRGYLTLMTANRLGIRSVSDYLKHIMALPLTFFDNRKIGDVLQRIGDYQRVQNFVVGSLLSMIIALISIVIYSVIIANYQFWPFIVFFVGTAIYLFWVLMFMKRRRRLDQMRFQESAKQQDNLVQIICGIQDIKQSNTEQRTRNKWESIQERLWRNRIQNLSLGQAQEIGGVFIEQGKTFIVSYLTAKAVINGEMTLGMMMAIQFILGQLNAPISQLIAFVQSTQDARISVERLSEIYEMEGEDSLSQNNTKPIPLHADIIVSDVNYSYPGADFGNVLSNLSFRINYGEVTAIVGPSGCGKTTLIKLLLGYYLPSSGVVMLGESNLQSFSCHSWRDVCGCVMQDGFIFSDTIASNITMSDKTPDEGRLFKAINTAEIREWIEGLPMGVYTKIGAEGMGISAGQKQRILIARAIYKDSDYLFFDEATNSLDAETEKKILRNLSAYSKGRTVVISAHRLSTIRSADHVIVLDEGKVIEEGKPSSLERQQGRYYHLVMNQIITSNQ